ncbi:MAG: hypothetical protein GY870_12065, partial [archaeon]|nr:hypothetical protein [archaeon]
EENKIENLNILLFFNDYKPGALLTIDGLKGHFFIKSLDSIEEAGDLKQYSNLGLMTGDIGPIIKAMGSGHFIRKMFMNMITRNRSVKFKGIGNLIKFGKLLLGGAL